MVSKVAIAANGSGCLRSGMKKAEAETSALMRVR